ncbi:hypothetical protein BKA70DRAFT_1467448 [Coprinopsis sp. MPI-PUGE-AT-0042]|nr:hypothetical protein BKA70DRAFT_1467448 [Coprinopsis sp. MPI-PUGE-AT-0042]
MTSVELKHDTIAFACASVLPGGELEAILGSSPKTPSRDDGALTALCSDPDPQSTTHLAILHQCIPRRNLDQIQGLASTISHLPNSFISSRHDTAARARQGIIDLEIRALIPRPTLSQLSPATSTSQTLYSFKLWMAHPEPRPIRLEEVEVCSAEMHMATARTPTIIPLTKATGPQDPSFVTNHSPVILARRWTANPFHADRAYTSLGFAQLKKGLGDTTA